jgi:hypothetical protein
MNTEWERIQAARAELKREYGDLYERVSRLLFAWDPIGINFEFNTDEYEPEVDTILPRLRTCTSAVDVQRIVHEEFCRWFDIDSAGGVERYEQIGRDIWVEIRDTRYAGDQER